MKRIAIITLGVAAGVLAAPALAQQKADDHAAHHAPPATGATAGAAMADGEIRRVDRSAAKLTIRHGEIPGLDMPPMTMVFQVKDASLIDKVKAGDRVRFRVEKSGVTYVVTEIEPVRPQ